MTLGHGPKIVTKGLVFAYDMHPDAAASGKSWKGQPTANYIWHQNPRIDSSYSSYVQTTSGTWPQNHNEAITVYNKAGGNITGYVNTGVTDYTNTHHAHWILDPELSRPVVIMRNYDNNWKAKSFSVGKTKGDMGLAVGDTYTISWLQWTDNIARSADVGLYSSNGTSNNFWDGRQYAYNTKVATWQRVHATYTVSNNGTTYATNIYMYGHTQGTGVVKIADVQLEKGGPSPFISGDSEANSTRSNTQALLDWTGNYTLTASSGVIYNSDGTFSFTTTANTSYFDLNSQNIISGTNPFTIEAWTNKTSGTLGEILGNYGSGYASGLWFATAGLYIVGSVYHTDYANSMAGKHHSAVTRDSSGNVKLYRDGVLSNTGTLTSSIPSNINFRIGADVNSGGEALGGNIYNVKVYNTVLTAAEVKQNFNALRGRYGI